MKKRLGVIGMMLIVVGFGFVVAGGVAYAKVQDGYDSLQAFSEVQNVQLNYNEDGQLVDRGEVAGAEAIMATLTDTWQYPVSQSDFDPNDPLVNTASEYMYQMATIVHHTTIGHADGRPPRGRHGRRRHGVRGRDVRGRRDRPLLDRLRPLEPARRSGT